MSKASSTAHPTEDLTVVLALARLLERIESRPLAVTADQYRLVAERLTGALHDAAPSDTLQAVLGAHPAAAELYENMQYEHAGLVRSSLEASMNSEKLAKAAILQAARSAAAPRH